MSISPINSSFSFIPGYMSEPSALEETVNVLSPSPSARPLAGRVTLLSPRSSLLPHLGNDLEYEVDLYDEGTKKPSPPVFPPFPAKPQKQNINTIREIPLDLANDKFFLDHECPITGFAIRNPGVDGRHPGHIYEWDAISEWVSVNMRSPMNGGAMTLTDLVPHVQLKQEIDDRLRIWCENQYADALQKHEEAVKKHEEEVQEILVKYKLAMSEYEVALKEREEEEQSRQMPYGADLLKSKISEAQKINDFEKMRSLDQDIRKVHSFVMQGLGSGLMGSAMMSQSFPEELHRESAAAMGMPLGGRHRTT